MNWRGLPEFVDGTTAMRASIVLWAARCCALLFVAGALASAYLDIFVIAPLKARNEPWLLWLALFFMIAAVGIFRMTEWGRIVARFALLALLVAWFLLLRSGVADDWRSVLAPLFSDPFAGSGFSFLDLLGLAISIAVIVLFGENLALFRRKLW